MQPNSPRSVVNCDKMDERDLSINKRRVLMTAITFDTLAYFEKLKSAGVSEPQAKVQAETLAEIIDEKLATKRDLKELEQKLIYRLTLRLGGMIVIFTSITITTLGFLMDWMLKGISH